MRILVTGANGYLGRGIVKYLLNKGQQVIATDFSDENIDSRAVVKCCDIFSLDDPYKYFGKPDIVLHLAWRNGFVHNADTHILDLPRHIFFLKKFIDNNVKAVAVMGSMHEVGFYEGCIHETTPCNPMNDYGIAKNALRQCLVNYCSNKQTKLIWLRGFYIVGTEPCGSSIFSKIVKSAFEGKKEFPFTKGLNQYDFLDYQDFCKQVSEAVTQYEITGIINICSGYPEKLSDRVERFIFENGFDIKLKYGAYPDRPYDSKALWGNNVKINRILKKDN